LIDDLISQAKETLVATGSFRILQRIEDRRTFLADVPVNAPRKIAAVVDVETTGLNPRSHHIIELSIKTFEYRSDTGEVIRLLGNKSWLEDPGYPLPEKIKSLTSLTDDMLKGRRIDDDVATDMLNEASLIIAHNAAFDREFIERRLPLVPRLPWGCSLRDIDWTAEGISIAKLEHLILALGLFNDQFHRAAEDTKALLHILASQLPRSHTPALAQLLANANQSFSRIVAIGSPFEDKDILKDADYNWSASNPKAWYIDVPADQEEEALTRLREMSPLTNPRVYRYGPEDRFTDRLYGRETHPTATPKTAVEPIMNPPKPPAVIKPTALLPRLINGLLRHAS
jgi:DNA polymerase-3 subunit epsilon